LRVATQVLAAPAKSKGLELRLEVAPDVPHTVVGDALRLKQVLTNLTGNAIKFTQHGEVTVSVSVVDTLEEALVVGFSVRDTGIGIDQNHLERIFERFYVVDASRSRATGGTGLGLSIVKHIVLLHKGEITVKSIPETGTTVLVKLPLSGQQTDAGEDIVEGF